MKYSNLARALMFGMAGVSLFAPLSTPVDSAKPEFPAFDTFDAYLHHFHTTPAPEHFRRGQYAWSLLHASRPALSDGVRSRNGLDPFNVDANIPAFLDWVEKHWNRNESFSGFNNECAAVFV